MKRHVLILYVLLAVSSLALAQNQTDPQNQTGSACVNDGICTIHEYEMGCLDCRQEVAPPNPAGLEEPQKVDLKLWIILGVACLLVLFGVLVVLGYVIYRRFFTRTRSKPGSKIRLG